MNLITILSDVVELLSKYWHRFLVVGVGTTIILALISVVGGTLLGTLIAIGRMTKFKPLRAVITAYVEIVRGTPALVQLTIGYVLVPNIIPSINNMAPTTMGFICVAIALILNSGAYVSEIIRSGIEAVDKGQTEAARSLGLTSKTTMIQVVLPQAVKNILPALGNEFITIIKETSLASTFFVGELMTQYKEIVGVTFNAFPALLIVSAIYFVLNFILSKALKLYERRLKAHA